MPAELTQLADAVVAELVAHTWSQPLSPLRVYTVEYGVEELAELKVLVVPAAYARKTLSRSMCQRDHVIDIGLLKRTANDRAENDTLIGLMLELVDYFDDLPQLAAMPQAKPVEVTLDPIYDFDVLRKKGVFQSVLTLQLRITD